MSNRQKLNQLQYQSNHIGILNKCYDHYTFLENVPTYFSPKPTFFPKWEVSVNVNLGEG